MAGGTLQSVLRLGLLSAGALVPGAAAVKYHSAVAHHPVLAAMLAVGYEIVLIAVGFAAKVFDGLQAKWVERAVEGVDRRLTWGASRLQRIYLRQLRASVQDMETIGVATAGEFVLRMRQVYVDVSLAPQVLHATSSEPYLGTVPGSEAAAGLGQRRSLESVLRDAEREVSSRVLVVIGGPGSGKTTLARNTALTLCDHGWRWGRRQLPVLLYLRDHAGLLLADQPQGLAEVAASARWLGGKVPAAWLERRLDRGGCVVLLDGLDEVADPIERSRVVAWVEHQTEQHPGNTYVVTSRPHGYQTNPLPRAEVLQVRRFTPTQIERFLHQWSYATESRARADAGREARAAADRYARDLLDRLRAQPALYDLAANPLLLTMTANVHRYRGALPGSRAELYAEMCDVLLHRRSEARGLQDATGLSGTHKQHVAQHLALDMTKKRVRDWPAHDAIRAIRRPLRQVPGNVPPEVFLEEARKSGLLVEREQGVYGFAHLTLQEYLAAAQLGTPRADATVLSGRVNDPWWRETILLWAAGNDATEVISACLASGTVPALALAFDCAEQAKTVEPAARAALDTLLAPPGPGQFVARARRQLLAGIQATRTLRETISVGDITALSARPIPNALYDLFIYDEQHQGRHHGHESSTNSDPDEPATGMHAGDAERFIVWLNDLTGTDTSYRLPTPQELTDPATSMVADLARHTIWAQNGTRTLLHRPPGVNWPYTPTSQQLRLVPARDRRHTTTYLRILTTSDRQRVERWAKVLTTALRSNPTPGNEADLASDLTALGLVRALVLARDLERALAFERTLGPEHVTCDHPLSYEFALDRALDLALALHLDLNRDRDLDRALDRARARARTLARILGLDIDREHALTRALDYAHTYDLDHDQTLDRGLDVAHALARALAGALALNLDLGFSLDYGQDHVYDQDHDHVHDRVRDVDLEVERDVDLARDIALDLARDDLPLQPTVLALSAFQCLPSSEHEGSLLRLDDLLTRTGAISSALTQQPPEDPAHTLRHVRSLPLQRTPAVAPPDEILQLLERTEALLTAIRDRTAPPDFRTLACARIALLAATTALQEAPNQQVARLLHQTWQSLVTYSYPASDEAARNQILLIAHNQQQ